MPDFSFNLISLPKLTKTLNCQLMLNDTDCIIQNTHSKKMIDTTRLNGELCILDSPSVTLYHTPSTHSINTLHNHSLDISQNCNLWHLRLGHPSNTKLIQLNKCFPFVKSVNSAISCDVCFNAKQKRLPFSLSSHVSTSVFDLVHMDIWGPLSTPSMMGYRYFLTIVDDKNRFTWLFLMRLKFEASSIIKSFVSMIKTQFNITNQV